MPRLINSFLALVTAAAVLAAPQQHKDSCPFDVGTTRAECFTVPVPLDYQDPDGKQI